MIPLRRLAFLVVLAMIAFAANSLLCRAALRDTGIDPASFTTIRVASGAAVLWVIARMNGGTMTSAGSWSSAAALFGYAAAFSFAYIELSAAMGALILFCAVQVTMIGWGLWRGERIGAGQGAGLSLAIGGLVGLLWPGLSAPPPGSAALMLAAGIAWGIYSLRGKRSGDPTIATAGNFMRAVPFAVVLLDEAITLRLVLGSAAILGGIALVVMAKRPA